jgi:hypothetical protein
VREQNPDAHLIVYGQDYNKRAYAIAASDMLIKGHQDSKIEYGNTLKEDKFPGEMFDYLLANPPFGVNWEAESKEIRQEHEKLGYDGRFGPGLPRVSDGALLFLLHMISKFEMCDPSKEKNGARLGIVFNGSPLFTGGAGSGESEIRRWIIENDWLEAIVALPEQMFYNTGIGTYVWIVTNRKEKQRKGKIQLWLTPASDGRRCAARWATNGASSPNRTSRRFPRNTACSNRPRPVRFSATTILAIAGLPSSGHSSCAFRTRRSARSSFSIPAGACSTSSKPWSPNSELIHPTIGTKCGRGFKRSRKKRRRFGIPRKGNCSGMFSPSEIPIARPWSRSRAKPLTGYPRS